MSQDVSIKKLISLSMYNFLCWNKKAKLFFCGWICGECVGNY